MFLSFSPPPQAEGFHLKVARAPAFRLQSILYRFPKDKAEKLISITNVERLHLAAPEWSVNPGDPGAGDEAPARSKHMVPTHSCLWHKHTQAPGPTHTHASHTRRLRFLPHVQPVFCCVSPTWTSCHLQVLLLTHFLVSWGSGDGSLTLSTCGHLDMVCFPKGWWVEGLILRVAV